MENTSGKTTVQAAVSIETGKNKDEGTMWAPLKKLCKGAQAVK